MNTLRPALRRVAALSTLLALATLALVAGPATSAAAATEWSVVPATADGADGRVSLRHSVEPGASVGDAIVVTNLGAESARFAVTAGDGIVGDSGAFDIARGEPTGSGAWITVGGLDDGGLTLAGGEARVLPVTIAVPTEVTPGDHPAGIVVGVSSGDDTSTVTTRLGVRVHLRVAGDVEPGLEVRSVEASFTPSWIPFAPGSLDIEYTLENTGNVRLGAAAELRAAGPFSLAGSHVVEQAGELLPGDDIERRVQLDVAPLMLLFGELEVSPLAVGQDDVALPTAITEQYSTVAASWTGLALLVVLGAVGWLLVRRRHNPRPGRRE